jgi:hypothetical protein
MIGILLRTITCALATVAWLMFGVMTLKISKKYRIVSFVAAWFLSNWLYKNVFGVGFLPVWLANLINVNAYFLGTRLCVIGLTGGIACGKTAVCEILKSNGFKIVDADLISH